jgi:hypothetical protein
MLLATKHNIGLVWDMLARPTQIFVLTPPQRRSHAACGFYAASLAVKGHVPRLHSLDPPRHCERLS